MVLAAGRGERLRPLTDRIPKPLIEVAGKTMLDRVLDALAAAGVVEAVVNTHHLAESVTRHVAGRTAPRLTLSHEDILLDTGGGVAKALPVLGAKPFYVANSDIVVLDGIHPVFERLADAWRDADMDALLLVHPTVRAFGYDGLGDFVLTPDGVARRRREREIAPYLFAGLQVLAPRLFDRCPDGPFSLNLLYDRAADAGRLHGLVHDGLWMHVGTPDALGGAEDYLKRVA
jgi:MurNAc alpha-1-phosphate uridylyltransferase